MGIAEKKTDQLRTIHGPQAERYQEAVRLLMAGKTPEGWQWLSSSRDTAVAVCTSGPAVYYKEFLPRDRFETIKSLLRGSRCHRARRQADILRSAELPTPAILCWGAGRSNSFLLSEGFAGLGFFHYVSTHFPPPLDRERIRQKRLLLARAGELIGRLHRAGIVHGDLRQNNLLVQKIGNDFCFSLIDNESNRKWPLVPRSQIIKNLVQFAIVAGAALTRTDLLRLFHAYATVFPRFAGNNRRRLLKTVSLRSRLRTLDSRMKWEMRTCRAFTMGTSHGHYLAGSVVEGVLAQGLDPARWFDQAKTTLKEDGRITVRLLPGAGEDVIAKRFTANTLPAFLQSLFTRDRVLHLWEMSHRFQALAVPVAIPFGYALAKRGRWRPVSYFYSRNLGHAPNLGLIRRDMDDRFPAWLAEKQIVSRIARLLATLHNHRLCHGDTKWANILVDPSSGELWLIDLDGAGHIHSSFPRLARKDLGRFMANMIEAGLPDFFLTEFLSHYCGLRRLNRELATKKVRPHIDKILSRHAKQKKEATR